MTRAFYLGLTPWLVFVVADRSAGVGRTPAALIAAVVAVVIGGVELQARQLRPLPVAAVVMFTALAAGWAQTGVAMPAWVSDRALASGLLAAVLLVSVWHTPLTLVYARDAVPPSRGADSGFRRDNVALTLRWSASAASIAVSFALGATVAGPLTSTLFNWLLPIAIVAVAAARFGVQSEWGSDETSIVTILDVLTSGSSHQSVPQPVTRPLEIVQRDHTSPPYREGRRRSSVSIPPREPQTPK